MTWPTIFDHRLDEYYVMDLPGQQLSSAHATNYLDNVLNLDIKAPAGCQRLTTIMATMGPSTYDVDIMEKMMAAGMNIAVLNLSFGTQEDHIEEIRMLREAAARFKETMGKKYPIAIALRLTGRKIRTGKIAETFGDHVELVVGEFVRLTTEDTYKDRCTPSTIFIDFVYFAEQLKKGDTVLLDNERIKLTVDVISATTLTCKIERGGILGSNKDVYVPKVVLNMPDYIQAIQDDVKMAQEYDVDFLIASFVSGVTHIHELRPLLKKGGKSIGIIANIQTVEGFRNIEEILQVADAIMVTRQELGSDITPEKLPVAQKNLIARANKANVPVCISCHLLSNMRVSRTATRAELLDISNCILDGADCLELGPETAVGIDPVLTVATMNNACREAESCIWTRGVFSDLVEKTPSPCDHITGTSMAAVLAAQRSIASAIVVITTSGKTAQVVSKYRPRCPILAVIRKEKAGRQLHLWRGVIPYIYEGEQHDDWLAEVEIRLSAGLKWAVEKGFIRTGDPIVVVYCWKQDKTYTNSMRVMYVPKKLRPLKH